MIFARHPAGRSSLKTLLAFALFGFAAALFIGDIWRTRSQHIGDPAAVRIAAANLSQVQSSGSGWFPFQRDPAYGWEKDEQGWELEDDNPTALTPIDRPDAVTPGLGAESVSTSVEVEDEPKAPEPKKDEPSSPSRSAKMESSGLKAKKLRRTSDPHNEGKFSLAVPVHFPDPATIFRFNGQPNDVNKMLGVRFIAYDVFIPADCPGFAGCLFFLKDKDGLWFQARSQAALLPGRWTTVTADIRGGSPDVTPLGHIGQWDDNQASQIKTIGITFYGDKVYRGQIYVDNFRGWVRAQRFVAMVNQFNAPNSPMIPPAPEAVAKLQEMKPGAETYRDEPLRIINFRTEPAAPPVAPGEASSPPVVPKFETFTLRFELNRQPENPFDPEKADIGCLVETPSGQRISHIGFWYQDYDNADRFAGDDLTPIGRPEWRVRITPREEGEYRYTLRVRMKDEELTSSTKSFVSIPSQNKGFVRVSPTDQRFFEFENGEFFYPIGHNLHSTVDIRCWKELLKQEPPAGRGLGMYSEMFPKLKQSGENVAEVWMASWWLGIEWTSKWRDYYGAGRYSLQHAWKLDSLLKMARENGLEIHLVLDNHGKFSSYCDWEWELNPYNRKGDPTGIVTQAKEFFTDATAQKWHRNKLRYIAARWGCDPTILGWELVSEFDLVGGETSRNDPMGRELRQRQQFHKSGPMQDWVRKMVPYLRQCDVYHHPITNHYASDYTWVDPEIARGPLLDYVTTDAYRQPNPYMWQAMANQNWFNRQIAPGGLKPFWITEYGGDFNGVQQVSQMTADVHAGPWATWMTDGCGTPLIWWYDYIDQNNLYSHYRAFANYTRGEDRRGIKGIQGPLPKIGLDDQRELQSYCYRWPTGAYAWVYSRKAMSALPEQSKRPHFENVEDNIPGLQTGDYRVEYWDTYDGTVVRSETKALKAGEQLQLKFPPFDNDIAVKVKLVKAM